MYRALIAAVFLTLSAPALAGIRGATCTTSDLYLPGGTATMCWTCTNGSPATPDPECLDEVALGYPEGWTVACGSQEPASSGGEPVGLECDAGGQNVTYADSDGGTGEICPGQSWSFCIDVTAPTTVTEPTCVFYTLSGDGSGDEPHDIIDCNTVQPARGSVTIANETEPQDAGQAFQYAGDLGAFSLTGGQSTTLGPLLPGTYDVRELLPAGWDLSRINCDDPDGGTTVDLATSSVSIDVDDDEHVVCTFHNAAQGSVTIVKETVPQESGGQLFDFAGGLGAFSLAGGESTTSSGLAPGTYDVTETLPAGWDLTRISCEDPDGGTTVDLGTATAGIDLDPAEHVTCTFENTARGSVTITNETQPLGAGQVFDYAGDLGAFSLAGGESTTIGDLEPGQYHVTEALPGGWDLSQITCEDPDGGTSVDLGTGTVDIDVDPGEHVTCTFLNAATEASITIVKLTLPRDSGGQHFDFEGDLGQFSLTGGGRTTRRGLEPGRYDVIEAVPAGWQLTSISCQDPDGGTTVDDETATASIDLDPGEPITCTFNDRAEGYVPIPIPTLSPWMLLLLAGLLAVAGALVIRARTAG